MHIPLSSIYLVACDDPENFVKGGSNFDNVFFSFFFFLFFLV